MTANEKAKIFHNEVMTTVDMIAPQKTRKFSNDDKPWYTEQLKKTEEN